MVKRDGDDAILKELTAGQWFGESEVKTSQASGANVIAKTPVQLFQLDRASYLATFGQVCVYVG
jgi:CRP-like cAMP-binding protein